MAETTNITPTTTSKPADNQHPSGSPSQQWWDIIAPIIAFIFIFIVVATCCKCLLQYCGNCLPRRNRNGDNNGNEAGTDNADFVPDGDLPPSYSVMRMARDSVIEMFRVEAVSEPSESRRGSSSVSEKLPTYAEIVEEKRLKQESLQSVSQHPTSLHVEEETVSNDVTTVHVTTNDVITQHAVIEDLEQSSSDEEGVPPPAYTEH